MSISFFTTKNSAEDECSHLSIQITQHWLKPDGIYAKILIVGDFPFLSVGFDFWVQQEWHNSEIKLNIIDFEQNVVMQKSYQ